MSGDLGLSPGTSVTGFPPGLMNGGVQNVANPAAVQAKSDLAAAYDEAAAQAPATPVAASTLGGLTLTPGVYSGGALDLTGTLTLDAQGDSGGRLRLPGGVDADHRVGEPGGAGQRRLPVQRLLEGRKLGDARDDHELQGNDPRPRVDHGEHRRHGGRPAAGAYRRGDAGQQHDQQRPTCSSPPDRRSPAGVGEIDAAAAAAHVAPPNPNENLNAFVAVDPLTGQPAFDGLRWVNVVSTTANWTTANWTTANWTTANWTTANWTTANWTTANWTTANWTTANWTTANWTTANWTTANWPE